MVIDIRVSGRRRTVDAAVSAFGLTLVLGSVWVLRHWTSERVQRWGRGAGALQHSGPLGTRVFGKGETVLVLLPGIAASQAFYGTAYDRLRDMATVVVVDPLGFGSSMDAGTDPGSFALNRHIEALSGTLQDLGLDQRQLVVAGHSMGASLALQWAAVLDGNVREVIAFDAPLYSSRREARARVKNMGWFEAFLSSGPLARVACWWMCRHRAMASVAAVLMNPSIPMAIARDGVRHTWYSYIQSFEALVAGDTWSGALSELSARDVPVDLIEGTWDRVPEPGRINVLAGRFASTTSRRTHPSGHDLPLSSPGWCSEFIYTRMTRAGLIIDPKSSGRAVQ